MVRAIREGDAAALDRTWGAIKNQRLNDGATAARGDLIQVTYGGAGYGVVLSIDGTGKVTPHWPDKGFSDAAAIKAGANLVSSAY